MNLELEDEHRMLKDLVGRFVRDELMPLEAAVLAREAESGRWCCCPRSTRGWTALEGARPVGPGRPGGRRRLRPAGVAMVGVNEELGRTITPYTLPPDSPTCAC